MFLATGFSLVLLGSGVRILAVSRETAWLKREADAHWAATLRGAFLLAELGTAVLALGIALLFFAALGATGLAIMLILTPLILLFGDGLPRAFPHRVPARGEARLLRMLGSLTGGKKENDNPAWSRADLATLFAEQPSEEASAERQMIRRVFDFADVLARDVMVPLVDVTALRDDSSVAQAVRVVRIQGHSRLPIFHERMPNVVGMIHAFDLLIPGEAKRVTDLMKPATYVPDMVLASDVLRQMQEDGVNLAIIVDEYGGSVGILTIEDLLEEVVGEIADEYDHDADLVRSLTDKKFCVGARAEVKDLNERFPWRLPDGDYETLGGLLLHHFGRIPTLGEKLELPYATLRVLRTRLRSIEEVEVESKEESS